MKATVLSVLLCSVVPAFALQPNLLDIGEMYQYFEQNDYVTQNMVGYEKEKWYVGVVLGMRQDPAGGVYLSVGIEPGGDELARLTAGNAEDSEKMASLSEGAMLQFSCVLGPAMGITYLPFTNCIFSGLFAQQQQ